jgi:hypothetical protein
MDPCWTDEIPGTGTIQLGCTMAAQGEGRQNVRVGIVHEESDDSYDNISDRIHNPTLTDQFVTFSSSGQVVTAELDLFPIPNTSVNGHRKESKKLRANFQKKYNCPDFLLPVFTDDDRKVLRIVIFARRPNHHFQGGNRNNSIKPEMHHVFVTGGTADHFARFVVRAFEGVLYKSAQSIDRVCCEKRWSLNHNSNGTIRFTLTRLDGFERNRPVDGFL